MITLDQFVASMQHETNVIKHLATKVPSGKLDWRPTPGQRSTIELLQYVTTCAIVPTKAMIAGNWDDAEAIEIASKSVTPGNFAAEMDRQMRDVEEAVRAIPERDLLTRATTAPWGTPTVLGISLVDYCLKPLVVYRMQLFLYAKESGNAALGPRNLWVGADSPTKPA